MARGTDAATLIGAVSILLWSALALLTTQTRGLPPFELLALSFGVACLGSMALLALRGRATPARLALPWRAWWLGFIGLFGYHALYFLALNNAAPAEASLIAYLWPLLIVLFAAALPGERLHVRHLAGAALGLAGTALIVLRGHDPAPGARGLGALAALGCALVWSGYSVLNRRFAGQRSEPIAGICGAVALAGLACTLAFEQPVLPDGRQWAAVAALGAGPVGLAFFAWDHATKHGRLAVLGALSYLAPLLSTALLIGFGQARPSVALLGAAVLVVAGAVIATRGPRRSNRHPLDRTLVATAPLLPKGERSE